MTPPRALLRAVLCNLPLTAELYSQAWQREREPGSVLVWVADEVTPVLAGDPSCDGEAESAAGNRGVEADEALEDPLALGVGNAGPVVCDLRFDVTVARCDSYVDAALGGDGRERVVEQVAEDASKCVGVTFDACVSLDCESELGAWRPGACVLDRG